VLPGAQNARGAPARPPRAWKRLPSCSMPSEMSLPPPTFARLRGRRAVLGASLPHAGRCQRASHTRVLRGGAGAKACPLHTGVAEALDASSLPCGYAPPCRADIISCSASVHRLLGPVCQRPRPRWRAVQPSWHRCAHAPHLRHCLVLLVEDAMVVAGHAEETRTVSSLRMALLDSHH
jgi:hypothetical protein